MPDQGTGGARILDVVSDPQSVVGVYLVVDAHKTPVIVGRLQETIQVTFVCRMGVAATAQTRHAAFRRQAQHGLCVVNEVYIADQVRGIGRRLGAAFPFVIHKEKSLVFLHRPAEGSAKLVLPQLVGQRSRLQHAPSICSVILKIFVQGAVQIVGAGLRHNVDNATGCSPVFRAKGVVDHAEFLHRFLRRGGPLHAGNRADEIGAVHRDRVAERALAAKRDLRSFKVGERRSQTGAARRHARSEQRKIGEQASIDGQRVDLLGLDHLTDFGLGGLDDRSFGSDHDLFRATRNAEGDVQCGRLTDGQNDSRLRGFGEARRFHSEFIATRRHAGKHVESIAVRDGAIAPVGVGIA